ncbi:hypothetical protein ACFRCI_34240 [Streptomyces sp. NPDC056638]|uniref:hypothetical protein n=1 Tax=Streptomyces sp. NPDC056638 TaxID=3345887 RepID=UPI0036A991CE
MARVIMFCPVRCTDAVQKGGEGLKLKRRPRLVGEFMGERAQTGTSEGAVGVVDRRQRQALARGQVVGGDGEPEEKLFGDGRQVLEELRERAARTETVSSADVSRVRALKRWLMNGPAYWAGRCSVPGASRDGAECDAIADFLTADRTSADEVPPDPHGGWKR